MSVQDLTPSFDETAAEPEDVTVRRLVRAVDYAEGFWLGFAKSNTLAQRRRLAALCKDLLEALKIRVVEIELSEPVTDLLPILRERLAQERDAHVEDTPTGEASPKEGRGKIAIFVHGLEHSIPSREAYPPLLSSLNLNRELFRQQVPHPLLLWLPDYALTALARKSPDFWAWRSGLYEFPPERETAEQSFAAIRDEEAYVIESLSEPAKRVRLVMLKGLLEDYRELGNSAREQSAQGRLLHEIGLVYETLGELAEARRAYEESLVVSRNLKDKLLQGVTLNDLGIVSEQMGDFMEAKRLYGEFLNIARELNSRFNIAAALHQLGNVACIEGELKEAKQLYIESLEISNALGAQYSKASTLHQLGTIAQDEGNLNEARRFYTESLKISRDLNHQLNVAKTLKQLGNLAHTEGDITEAIRLFREAFNLFESLGSPEAKATHEDLALMDSSSDLSD